MSERIITPEQAEEEVLAYLERERAIWLIAKAKDERAGGWNGEAKHDRAASMRRLDGLLEEYFGMLTVREAMRNGREH